LHGTINPTPMNDHTNQQVIARLRPIVAKQRYPLLFATVSGAHLYGFPSPDSDYDLRGVHLLPAAEVLGLTVGPETIESTDQTDLDLDLVTHDAHKFFTLMLRRNGLVLENLTSPLVVHTTPAHAELVALVPGCVTRHHANHYLGFAATQWGLFDKESPRRVKPLLYTYRVLLTGIHLMRTGTVEANLVTLNDTYRLPQVPDLVAAKLAGPERATLADAEVSFHAAEYARLRGELEAAYAASTLPEAASVKPALHDLLLRLRMP
jgi:predicted nucleotidyltransferase